MPKRSHRNQPRNGRSNKHRKTLASNAKSKHIALSIGRMFNLNKISLDIDAVQPVYSRTGQTSYSFSIASQVNYLNLPNLIANSNNYIKYVTSGVPNYEFIKCTGFTLTWRPTNVTSVSATFEPAAFGLRYFSAYSVDSVLPSSYGGNFNECQFPVTLQQFNRTYSRIFSLQSLPTYITTESNRQVLGQLINGYNFTNYASQLGGILSMIMPESTTNTIIAYNPKIGYIELKFHCEIYNSIV